MNMTVVLIFVSVAMTTTAQILLKVGMSLPGVEQAIYEGALLDKLWAVVFNLPVVGGVCVWVWVWLWVWVLGSTEPWANRANSRCAISMLARTGSV